MKQSNNKKTPKRRVKRKGKSRDNPITLSPLEFSEAVGALLAVKPKSKNQQSD